MVALGVLVLGSSAAGDAWARYPLRLATQADTTCAQAFVRCNGASPWNFSDWINGAIAFNVGGATGPFPWLLVDDFGVTGGVQDFFQAVVHQTGTPPGLAVNGILASGADPGVTVTTSSADVTAPEPGAMVLVASGLIGLLIVGFVRRRRRT